MQLYEAMRLSLIRESKLRMALGVDDRPAKRQSRRLSRMSDRRAQFNEEMKLNPVNKLTGRETQALMKKGLKYREMGREALKIIQQREAK